MKLTPTMALFIGLGFSAQTYSAEVFTVLAPEAKSYESLPSTTYPMTYWGTDQTNSDTDGSKLIKFTKSSATAALTRTVLQTNTVADLMPRVSGSTHAAKGMSGYIEQVWPLQDGGVLFATDTYALGTGVVGPSYLYKLNTTTGTVGNNAPSYNNNRAFMNIGERNNIPVTDIRALHHRSLLESNIIVNGVRKLFYAEYNVGSAQLQVGIWQSTNKGDTWTKVIEWNTSGFQIRHMHGLVQNPYNNWIYFMAGDFDAEPGIIAWDGVSPAPPNNTPLLQIGSNNANGTPKYPGWRAISGSQRVRTGDIVFTPPPNGKCVWIPDVDEVALGEKLFGQRANYDLTGLEATGEIPYSNGFPPILGARSSNGNIYWASFRIGPSNEQKLHVWKSVDNGLNWLLAGKLDTYTSWTAMPQNLRITDTTTTATEKTDFLSLNGRDMEFYPSGQYTGSTAHFSSKTTSATGGVPVTVADSATTPKNQILNINVTNNDSNVGTSTINIVSPPAHGTAAVVSGVVRYTPATDYVGQDSFSYNLTGSAGTSNTSVVTVTVTDTGSTLPVANPDTATTPKGQAVTINLTANDTNVGTSKVNVVTYPDMGNLAFLDNSQQSIIFTPSANFVGQETFTYNLKNASGTSNTTTVTVTVTGGTTPTVPVTNPDSVTTPKDQTIVINVTGNDSNVGTSTINLVALPTHGTAVVAQGKVNYTPSPGYVGQDSFSYNLVNAAGTSNTSIVTVTISNTGGSAVANADTATTPRNQPITMNLTSNDSNIGDSKVNIVSYPDHGNLAYSDGTSRSVTYTPNTGYFGQDSYTYNLKSSTGVLSNTATVTITVQ